MLWGQELEVVFTCSVVLGTCPTDFAGQACIGPVLELNVPVEPKRRFRPGTTTGAAWAVQSELFLALASTLGSHFCLLSRQAPTLPSG